MMKKYDVLWNSNVLFEKNKHRFFKQTILFINNRKFEKQFLLKNVMRFIIKVVLSETFSFAHSDLISQCAKIQKQYSDLFIFFENCVLNQINDVFIAQFDTFHVGFSVRERLKLFYVKKFEFFHNITDISVSNFINVMNAAMIFYELQTIYWNKKIFILIWRMHLYLSVNAKAMNDSHQWLFEIDFWIFHSNQSHLHSYSWSKNISKNLFLNSSFRTCFISEWSSSIKILSIDWWSINCFFVRNNFEQNVFCYYISNFEWFDIFWHIFRHEFNVLWLKYKFFVT